MYWWTFLVISFLIFLSTLALAFILSKLAYKKSRFFTPNRALIIGTFLASTVLLCPIYTVKLFQFAGFFEYLKSIMLSALHALRLFAFDGGYAECFESDIVRTLTAPLNTLYSGFGAFFYIFSPILTLNFVVSFFRDAVAYRKYIISSKMHTHVFSELNEKSLALATDIDQKNNKRLDNPGKYKFFKTDLFVFTGVGSEYENNKTLLDGARAIGAICFSKDINNINYTNPHRSRRKLSFYIMSENKEDHVRHAEGIMNHYDLLNVELRVFSSDIRTELLLAAKDVKNIKVIRTNEAQALIYHNLDAHGMRLFKNARTSESGEKVISAVIVGLGHYGTEMLLDLAWFCQMDGYTLKIRAFDRNTSARDNFSAMCPELIDEKINGKKIPGEAQYDIDIIGGIDVNSSSFEREFSKITDATYVLVCLGNDVDNLNAAVKIRAITERIEYPNGNRKPDIETIIYSSDIVELMSEKWQKDSSNNNAEGIKNFKNQAYRIHMIGNLKELYSVDTMLKSALVFQAESANTQYAMRVYESELENAMALSPSDFSKEKEKIEKKKNENIRAFYKYDYNFRASLARIIHEKKSIELGTKNPTQEHRRWNAYMRSEGYRFSGSKESSSRNDLGKLHHNLVPFEELTEAVDLKKDE